MNTSSDFNRRLNELYYKHSDASSVNKTVDNVLKKGGITDLDKFRILVNPGRAEFKFIDPPIGPLKGDAQALMRERLTLIESHFSERILTESQKRFEKLETVITFIKDNQHVFENDPEFMFDVIMKLQSFIKIEKEKGKTTDIAEGFFSRLSNFIKGENPQETIEMAQTLLDELTIKYFGVPTEDELRNIFRSDRELTKLDLRHLRCLVADFSKNSWQIRGFPSDLSPLLQKSLRKQGMRSTEEIAFDLSMTTLSPHVRTSPNHTSDETSTTIEPKPTPNKPLTYQLLVSERDPGNSIKAMWQGIYEGNHVGTDVHPTSKFRFFHSFIANLNPELHDDCFKKIFDTTSMLEIETFLTALENYNNDPHYDYQCDYYQSLRHAPIKEYLQHLVEKKSAFDKPSIMMASILFVESIKTRDVETMQFAASCLQTHELRNDLIGCPQGTLNLIRFAKQILSPEDLKVFTENYEPAFPFDETTLQQTIDDFWYYTKNPELGLLFDDKRTFFTKAEVIAKVRELNADDDEPVEPESTLEAGAIVLPDHPPDELVETARLASAPSEEPSPSRTSISNEQREALIDVFGESTLPEQLRASQQT